jgi:hypothetical protein
MPKVRRIYFSQMQHIQLLLATFHEITEFQNYAESIITLFSINTSLN